MCTGDQNFELWPVILLLNVSSACEELFKILIVNLKKKRKKKKNNNNNTAEVQWLEHLWDHENLFETGVVRAYEC